MFKLARDKGRADKDGHESGEQLEPGQSAGQETIWLGERALDLSAVRKLRMRDAGGHAERLKARCDLYPSDNQNRCQGAQPDGRDQRLATMLPPDQPCHTSRLLTIQMVSPTSAAARSKKTPTSMLWNSQ